MTAENALQAITTPLRTGPITGEKRAGLPECTKFLKKKVSTNKNTADVSIHYEIPTNGAKKRTEKQSISGKTFTKTNRLTSNALQNVLLFFLLNSTATLTLRLRKLKAPIPNLQSRISSAIFNSSIYLQQPLTGLALYQVITGFYNNH